jgi:hypothetical protein
MHGKEPQVQLPTLPRTYFFGALAPLRGISEYIARLRSGGRHECSEEGRGAQFSAKARWASLTALFSRLLLSPGTYVSRLAYEKSFPDRSDIFMVAVLLPATEQTTSSRVPVCKPSQLHLPLGPTVWRWEAGTGRTAAHAKSNPSQSLLYIRLLESTPSSNNEIELAHCDGSWLYLALNPGGGHC